MGSSGSGKTTLLNCISTIDTVTSGHIYVEGKDITTLHGSQLADFRGKKLGFIFQDFNLLDTLTAYENISLALSIAGTKPSEIQKCVPQIAKALNIQEVLNKYPYQMSGGQQQRVLLARALCATSKLLLLDEPVTGLDPLATAELYAIIKALNREQGITILMVSHDVSCALHDATMVLHLSDKGMAFFGTAQAYHLSPISQPFLRCDCVGHHNSHVCDASCGGNVP